MNQPNRRIKGLAEVAIRVQNLALMRKFYELVLGLEVLWEEDTFVFYKIADGYAGNTQKLALFDATNREMLEPKSLQLNADQTTLHHVALNIALEDFDSERKRLLGLGIKVRAYEHPRLHLRSQYFPDPEGNLLELLAYDPTLK